MKVQEVMVIIEEVRSIEGKSFLPKIEPEIAAALSGGKEKLKEAVELYLEHIAFLQDLEKPNLPTTWVLPYEKGLILTIELGDIVEEKEEKEDKETGELKKLIEKKLGPMAKYLLENPIGFKITFFTP